MTATTLELSQNKGNTATTASGDSSQDTISQVVSFRLANEEYGLNIMRVREIILMGEITKIPEAPSYIEGLINLRGKVIPILDLRKRFGLEATPPCDQTRIVVVNTGEGVTFGIVVDAVTEVMRVDPAQVEPPPTGLSGLDRSYIHGLFKQQERIMILLNMENVLSQDDKSLLEKSTTN